MPSNQQRFPQYLIAANPFINPTGNPVTDYNNIQNALSLFGPVYLGPGTFMLTRGLVISSATALIGAGSGLTTLKLAPNVNDTVVSSLGFPSLTGGGSSGGINSFEIGGLTIDGNSSQNSAPASDRGHGVAVYGRKFFIHDLYIKNCYRTGLWTEYATGGRGVSPYDGHLARITVDTVGERGWWNGVSDIHFDDMNIRSPSQNQDAGFSAIKTTFAIHGSNINVWSSRGFNNPPYHGYAMHLGGSGSTITNVHLETAATALLYLDGNKNSVTGLFAYNPGEAGCIGVIVGGVGNTVQGVVSVENGNTDTIGIQLGTASVTPTGNTLLTYVVGWQRASYDFTYDTSGQNFIQGGNFNTGVATIGSAHFNDTVLTIGSGTGAFNRGRLSTQSGLTSEGFSVLGAKNQHNVAIAGSQADQSYNLVVPTDGFSTTIPNQTSAYLMNPAGDLASGTLVMPSTPFDGLLLCICSSKNVTAFTLSPNSGQSILNAPTTLVAGQQVFYRWMATPATWFRCQ